MTCWISRSMILQMPCAAIRYICFMGTLRLVFLAVLCSLVVPASTYAQADTSFIPQRLRAHLDVLAAPAMHGRGYVRGGLERAATYIEKQFRSFGLKPLGDNGYRQSYSFPVNTFPGAVELSLDGKTLKPGIDFLVDAGSASFSARSLPIKVIDLATQASVAGALGNDPTACLWVLRNVDTFCRAHNVKAYSFVATLPRGAFIVPQVTKAMWTVEQEQQQATVFYIADSLIPSSGIADVRVRASLRKTDNDNIIGYVPGIIRDSFIVFSAHYDHLGMMGADAIFPGASDNASGTSMLLYLAEYYAKHPQRYSMVFIAFSGEEAGLMGSRWFVSHPLLPLSNIRFLTNVDIMGNATDGITVVNATEQPAAFSLLNSINESKRYLPAIKSRGKAANSDHYFFSEAGVPAFFIYTNGGQGYYHDVYDKPGEISFTNVPSIAQLLADFVGGLLGN